MGEPGGLPSMGSHRVGHNWSDLAVAYMVNYFFFYKEDKSIQWERVVSSITGTGENAAAAAKSLQSFPTLCDPIDGSPPGSPIPGILQARTLERVAISFSNAWKWKVKVKSPSRVWCLATPWTAAYQAPPSMGFSRQEYWSGVPLPSPRVCLLFYISIYNQSLSKVI